MKKTLKHRFLNSVVCTALLLPLAFFLLRDTIAILTGILFRATAGEDSLLYQINDDIARLMIAGVLILIMPLFFRERCGFGFRGGNWKLGILLALPELIAPLWNLLQIKVYHAPFVAGATAVLAAIVHGIGPGVSEEVLCRGFVVSNLMRIWKDKPGRIRRCMLASGIAFGLLHAVNAIATGDILAVLVQVAYTAAIGILNGAIFLRSRSIWGVVLIHTLTDISAFISVFDESINATGMDIAFCIFGSLAFVALAFYLTRRAKQAEIDALWADGWSFGETDGKARAGAKVTGLVSAVLVICLIASFGVTIYQAKMGYDTPLFPAEETTLDKDVQYRLSDSKRELTILLPHTDAETYNLENSDPASLVLKESHESGNTYLFRFSHDGAGTERIKLTFSKTLGDMPIAIQDYTVTVSFNADGTIASVGG